MLKKLKIALPVIAAAMLCGAPITMAADNPARGADRKSVQHEPAQAKVSKQEKKPEAPAKSAQDDKGGKKEDSRQHNSKAGR